MGQRRIRIAVWSALLAAIVVGCGGATTPTGTPDVQAPPLPVLHLQVQNSGLHGGYLWLGSSNGVGRWHRLGEAELLCVTCPVPIDGAGFSYDVIVFDETCRMVGRVMPGGGDLRLVIDLGPKVSIGAAPPPTDWMPADSSPIDPASVPCRTA